MEICLQNVSKNFGGKVVFVGVQAKFSSGNCHCVCGENGSGKSTLLKCIARYMHLDEGKITAQEDGIHISKEEHRRLVGMIAPDFALYRELTAYENVKFFAGLRNVSLTQAVIEESLATVGLLSDSRRTIQEFSTGMQQRVKWAILLSSQLPIWLLDEPSSNLDESGRLLVKEQIQKAARQGKIVVMATNDPVEVEYATDVLALDEYKNLV